jgi:hypothetical protein
MPPRSDWLQNLNAVRAYLADHGGRFPPYQARHAHPATVELGRWWHSQRLHLGLGNLSANRARAVRDTLALARQFRPDGEANRRAAGDVVARQAARNAVRQARKAISSPYLVPGDAEVLQLRIEHPTVSTADLARLAGMTPAAYRAKLRGALRRGPLSRTGGH